MIFSYVLLDDWSARDIQAWECQPLGPVEAKATATTIGALIMTRAALRPFRRPNPALEVAVTPRGGAETTVARTSHAELSYSAAQQLAHHTSSGCPMNTGDLLGSGTISGLAPDARGCLLELSWGGRDPVAVAGGARTFLEDGDTVSLRGQCRAEGCTIGFGDSTGRVIAALADPHAREAGTFTRS